MPADTLTIRIAPDGDRERPAGGRPPVLRSRAAGLAGR
jgi:hypothetical protein